MLNMEVGCKMLFAMSGEAMPMDAWEHLSWETWWVMEASSRVV